MTIKSRFAEFKKRNDLTNEDVALYTIFGTTLVAFTGLFAFALHQDIKESKKIDEWSDAQYEAGRHVYQLSNGSLIATEKIYVY